MKSGLTVIQQSQSFLKWAGGKKRIAHLILACAPKDMTGYVEPFLGGGAVFFALREVGVRCYALLADTNSDLICAYRAVKRHPEELLERLSRLSYDRATYERLRKQTHFADDIERAARVIYLNRTCFNGLWRVNSRGEFNVPFGRYKRPRYYDPPRIYKCSRQLSGAIFRVQDFQKSLRQAREGSWVYCDPPYLPISPTSCFTSYTANGFSYDDYKRLFQAIYEAMDRGIRVCLSSSDTPQIHDLLALYIPFHAFRITAPRCISSNASSRKPVSELVICNYNPSHCDTILPFVQYLYREIKPL